jgi:TM2 domain-containing membrane protein YozV
MMLYDAQKKSALIAYLFWFFLWWTGAHRFYLGRTGSGAAMLVLSLVSWPLLFKAGLGLLGFVVVGVWSLVDAFLIPGMVSQHNSALATRLT